MEKISGLVLDVFDDANGSVLKSLYPTVAELPEVVKTAAALTRDQLEQLPDDVFALVLRQGDVSLRKFACVDAGNTLLHIGYFLMTHDKLPMPAIKTAANNLITACSWYDIEPPDELKKLSSGNLPVVGRQRIWKDTDGTTYGTDGTSWDLQKSAEAVASPDMPVSFGKDDLVSKTRKTPLSVAKTAEESGEVGNLVDTDAEGDCDTILEQAFGIKGEGPKELPQVTRTLDPLVDVGDVEPPKLIEEKKASYYALPHAQRYPLDSYGQVKAASAYFDQYVGMMTPEDRHIFATNLVQRATPMDISISKLAMDYGQTSFAPPSHIDACVGQRILLLSQYAEGEECMNKAASVHAVTLYKELMQKYAGMDPEVFARTLGEIDKIAGLDEFWGQDVMDPFLSTFQKTAEKDEGRDTLVVGNEYMSADDLKRFVANKPDTLCRKFSEGFLEEFQADPVGIFESLPMDQKLVLMRMVNGAVETSLS
jgi:hypothetical protein